MLRIRIMEVGLFNSGEIKEQFCFTFVANGNKTLPFPVVGF